MWDVEEFEDGTKDLGDDELAKNPVLLCDALCDATSVCVLADKGCEQTGKGQIQQSTEQRFCEKA